MAKEYLTLEVLGPIQWPNQEFFHRYRGRELRLRPESANLARMVTLEMIEGETIVEAREVISRFLSALSWATGEGSKAGFGVGSRGLPGNIGRSGRPSGYRECCFDYVPETSTNEQALALAIYREALFVNVEAFQLLGFCRLINLVVGRNGAKQVKWMNDTWPRLARKEFQDSALAIKQARGDVGGHIHFACRCAVAHASVTEATVDPDDVGHFRMIDEALPIARGLAEYAIEHELGVPSAGAPRNLSQYGFPSNRISAPAKGQQPANHAARNAKRS